MRSDSGDQGFPGTLDVTVDYRVREPATLEIDYRAIADAETVISLTNHSDINLHGDASTGDGHLLSANADCYLPVDAELIPSGEYSEVANSPYDYRTPRDIVSTGPLDTCFVLNATDRRLQTAAMLVSPVSGLGLTVYISQPALQVYTSGYLHHLFDPRAGLCLETQQLPDAANQAHFPQATLQPNERYHETTHFVFNLPMT